MSKLWTDNPRPWVNEHLSQPNQLGIAARLLSRWGKNWHKEKQDKATYDRAHNDIADLADTITSLLMDIDRLRQQVTQLTERNQRLQLTPAEKDAFDTFFHYLDKYAYMTPWLDDKDFVDVICAWGDRMDKDDADHE